MKTATARILGAIGALIMIVTLPTAILLTKPAEAMVVDRDRAIYDLVRAQERQAVAQEKILRELERIRRALEK